MNAVKIQKKLAHTAIYLFLLGAIFVAGSISVFHLLQDDSMLLDVVLPPFMAIFTLACIVYLYLIPGKLYDVTRVFLLVSATTLCFASWFFTLMAVFSEDIKLIDKLPPVSPVLLAIIFAMVIFLDDNLAKKMVIITWGMFSLPILSYLATHQEELLTVRGIEILVTLGPIMLMVFSLQIINKGIRYEIERLKIEKSDLKILSEEDPLTGLFNRRVGVDYLTSNINNNRDFSLILFDIDNFKRINDTHGHDIGDLVLIEIVKRCKTHIRSNDLFMRWGGEEFLIVIKEVNLDITTQIAEKLRTAIASEPIQNGLMVSASFGVTVANDSDSIETLLKRADTALYAAKQTGRNRVITQVQ